MQSGPRMRLLLISLVMTSFAAVAQTEPEDGGASEDAGVVVVAPTPPPPPAPAPAPELGFDGVVGPWGLARRSAGEKFSSAAVALPDGPLRWSWNGYSVALGGQYFARGDVRDNQDFNSQVGDHAIGVDHRARLSLRASAKDTVGLLLELQDVRGWGSELNTSTTAANTGLHQGFIDLRATKWLDVRVGRQELSYGEERLVGALDWNQNARAFDGVFARLKPTGAFTLDAFGMMVKPPQWLTTASDLRFHNSGTWFTGLYSRTRIEKSGVDVYALGLFEDPATAATGLAKDNNRATLGARAFTAISGLALVGEGAFQTGKVGAKEELLVAGAFAAKATWTFSSVWASSSPPGTRTSGTSTTSPGRTSSPSAAPSASARGARTCGSTCITSRRGTRRPRGPRRPAPPSSRLTPRALRATWAPRSTCRSPCRWACRTSRSPAASRSSRRVKKRRQRAPTRRRGASSRCARSSEEPV